VSPLVYVTVGFMSPLVSCHRWFHVTVGFMSQLVSCHSWFVLLLAGRIWRCARPSSASEADVCILLDQLGADADGAVHLCLS